MRFRILVGLLLLSCVTLLCWNPGSHLKSLESVKTPWLGNVQTTEPVLAESDGLEVAPTPVETRQHAHDPELLPGTIWTRGKVHYPAGISPAKDTRVWGRGGEWPNGEKWYGAEVQADGTFRMAFAERTEVGWLHLQDANCWAGSSYRVWQKGPIEFEAQEGQRLSLQVLGDGVDLEECRYSLTLGNSKSMPLISAGGHAYRFAIPRYKSAHVGVRGTSFPVLGWQAQAGETGAHQTGEIVISKPARITGKIVAPRGENLSYPWVQVSLLAQPVEEGKRPRTVYFGSEKAKTVDEPNVEEAAQGEYTYALDVPPGYMAKIMGHAKGGKTEAITTLILSPGQTIKAEDLDLSVRNTLLLGRLVDPAGVPIADAWIRTNRDMNADGVYMEDPARCVDHEVQTDSKGEFSMQTRSAEGYSIHALVPAAGEVPSPIADECGGGSTIQFFDVKANADARQVFVFDPVREGLRGVVRGPKGEPVRDFIVECKVAPSETSFMMCGGSIQLVSPSPYLPDDVHRSGLGSRGYHDATIKVRFHSDTGEFHLSSLPARNWKIKIRGRGYTSHSFPKVAVPNAEPLEVVLEVSGSILAEARGFSGELRSGVEVVATSERMDEAFPFNPRMISEQTTNGAGQVEMKGLPAGMYAVEIQQPGSQAGCTRYVEVEAGRTTEVLLQPEPRGEVVLVSPWPNSKLRVAPRLESLEPGRVYNFEKAHLNEPLHIRDVVPGAYRLSYWFQNKGEKQLVEPVIYVKAGERTEVSIRTNPGFIHITGQVLINGKPANRGDLYLDFPQTNLPRRKVRCGYGPFFYAVLPDVMPSKVIRKHDYERAEAVDWSRPSDGPVWQVHMTLMEVKLSLHDNQGNRITPPDGYRGICSLRPAVGDSWCKSEKIDDSIHFKAVPLGGHILQLARPSKAFPWHLMKTERLEVTGDQPLQEWEVEVKRAQPVRGETTSVDWPAGKRAWVIAWKDDSCKHQSGHAMFRPDREHSFEFVGPDVGTFWVSIEPNAYGHHAESEVFGPFQMTATGTKKIHVPAHYSEPIPAESED
ncbi:MAG: carboxypeptidase regulatory-like domain-containing protein [bacterium]|nr:carboxypeptidase regulatory-like domain-containing protein [bacterium]